MDEIEKAEHKRHEQEHAKLMEKINNLTPHHHGESGQELCTQGRSETRSHPFFKPDEK